MQLFGICYRNSQKNRELSDLFSGDEAGGFLCQQIAHRFSRCWGATYPESAAPLDCPLQIVNKSYALRAVVDVLLHLVAGEVIDSMIQVLREVRKHLSAFSRLRPGLCFFPRPFRQRRESVLRE